MLFDASDVTGDDGAACQIFSLTTPVWVFATCGGREDWEALQVVLAPGLYRVIWYVRPVLTHLLIPSYRA
ncbi:hypothetical protein IW261DRAFT_1572628 [Armillaria novae-zelandiae]|uniref:Uncharacterized protein n=1 Tax=Armillaria novae-zelandiae TaxID=153914 RepID=A0AA39NSC1_9AGAR|nr:hypothetical protein IW261DRAFT_1572628 [Armillaria novae-zelandiae]